MNLTPEEIKQKMGGRLAGSELMKNSVALAITKLPDDIAHKIIYNCWFFSSFEDNYGYAFNGNDLKDAHLIFLADILFQEPEPQILYTILHEIAHIALGHKNSIQYTQTKEEITKQETEADQFAKKYLYQYS
jgi:Zn-dependent peptidase ImmA (M78 family)